MDKYDKELHCFLIMVIKRRLIAGRDGLTHNMLDTIHCHWKRRRVCKIKCKGVPTVDMDNVCFQIEVNFLFLFTIPYSSLFSFRYCYNELDCAPPVECVRNLVR